MPAPLLKKPPLNLPLNDSIGIEERLFSIYNNTDSLEKQDDLRLPENSELAMDLLYSCFNSLDLKHQITKSMKQ